MKAKIGSFEVEGTPEEIGRLIREMGTVTSSQGDRKAETEGGRQFVPEEVAFKAIKRRALSDAQKALLSALAMGHPSWTSAHDLQKATSYSPNQLAGLLGALGKRVAATEGYPQGAVFLDYRWDYDEDCYFYRLPEGVFSAVKRAGL